MPEMRAFKRVPVVDLLCLPSDLRKLADNMERQIKKIRLGDDTVVEYIHGKRVTIAVRIDQDRL